MPRILVAGDSYASDWNQDYEWWKLLAHLSGCEVDSIAQAGSSEYRILKSLTNFEDYDIIIVFHTSPYRIYTEQNIIHQSSITHKNSDYLIGDTINHGGRIGKAMKGYVEHLYNEEYSLYQHIKVLEDIIDITKNKHTFHTSGFDYNDIYHIPDFYNITKIWKGNVCHMCREGNERIANFFLDKLRESHYI